jgi:hypothetical protein
LIEILQVLKGAKVDDVPEKFKASEAYENL